MSGAWGGRVGTVLPNQENQPPVGLSRIQKCTGATSASPIVSTWAADAVEAMPFSPSDSPCALAPVGSSEIASWARKVIDAPYFEPIPSTLLSRVRDLLNQSNTDFSSDCGGVLSGWANLTAAQPPTNAQSENDQDVQSQASPGAAGGPPTADKQLAPVPSPRLNRSGALAAALVYSAGPNAGVGPPGPLASAASMVYIAGSTAGVGPPSAAAAFGACRFFAGAGPLPVFSRHCPRSSQRIPRLPAGAGPRSPFLTAGPPRCVRVLS